MNDAELVIPAGLEELSSLVLLAAYTGLQVNLPAGIAVVFPNLEFFELFTFNWTFLPAGSSKISLTLVIDWYLAARIGIF